MKIKGFRFAALWVFALVVTLSIMAPAGKAQTISASLTGTVTDPTGAVVPGANVVLKNDASGDIRRTVSNGEGYFAFAAIPPGSYSVTVEMKGFNAWEATSVILNADDKRNLSGIVLKPGATKDTITVEAINEQITPVDSGEKSTVITARMMQNVSIVGQNAAEFIKIMPGMAMTGGTLNQASYAAQDEATGNGPVQAFAPNGLRTAALDITSDGAHIIDPGCNCGQAVNTNIEMTSELKVLTSNFGADASKGPAVITAISKSGGRQFHGSLFLYSRLYQMNANDWLNNRAGLGADLQPVAARPQTKYFYPGGNISGPLLLPWTHFNRNRDKLFFFFGTEYFKQDVDNGIYRAVVPTAAMRSGDFSNGSYLSVLSGGAITGVPNGAGVSGGIVPKSLIDHNGLAMMNTYPLNNVNPATNQGYNYINSGTRFSNLYQIRPKIDFNITDNTKLYVVYNLQRDNREESLDVLWTGNGQSWASPTTPYPTPLIESTHSDSVTTNLTHVFSPTLTNETVFTYTYLNLPNSFQDPTKVQRGSLGIDYKMLFTHADPSKLIFPQLTGWGDGISNMLNSGFELNGTVYALKKMPNVADNLSKVWGTHTAKFGFYAERTFNSQPGNGNVNGTGIFSNWGSNSTGNAYSDMLIGQTTQYAEQNFNTVPQFRYMSVDFYGQDSWKISKRVTLEYGLRISHLGPWSDITGYGFAAWYQNKYSDNPADVAKLTGLDWHKLDSSVPLSGSKTRLVFYNPRFGFAWDILGTGKTVLRGGYGMYHYHDEQNVQNGAYSITQGSYSNTLWSPLFSQVGSSSTSVPIPGGVQAVDPNDDQQPRTQSYSFTVAQRMPWNSLLEVAYVGNKADYLSNYNNNFSQINDVGVGTLFNKYGWLHDYSTDQQNAVRPMHNYQSVKITNHKMYSNYNGLQASWNKQAGHAYFMANYTFSKALGVRGENGAASGDPTALANNYGTLPNNRTHIFNAAYVFELPNAAKSNAILKGLVNDWKLSGMTQFQSGSDIQAAMSNNFGYSAWIPVGTTFKGTTLTTAWQTSNQNVIGTPDINLMPKLTCDPRKGLAKDQYVNPACFATPAIGTQGDYIFPVMTGPAFINSDLTLAKQFVWGASESRKIEIRFTGYNFLNHPVLTFTNNDPNLSLNYDQSGKLLIANQRFGYADNKTGHRIMQFMIKFSF